MAGRKYGRFTSEFRDECVREVLDVGKSVKAVALERGVDRGTLWHWVDDVRLKRIDPAGTLPVEARKRIRELELQNARLRRDLEFEKKAEAFFRELDHDENDSL